jgi:hypothetical protein
MKIGSAIDVNELLAIIVRRVALMICRVFVTTVGRYTIPIPYSVINPPKGEKGTK